MADASGGHSDEIPHGSYAAGRRVPLPEGAERPITVFINGVAREEGLDYEVADREIVFHRPIVKEKVSSMRWLAMLVGAAGTYRRNDTVDIEFTRDGRVELAGDLPVFD